MQGCRESPSGWFSVGILLLRGFIQGCGSCPCAVAIDERGEQPTIDISRDRDMVWLWHKVTNRFFAVPVAFDLMTMFIESATPVTMSEYIWILILKRFLRHEKVILY